ncbi:MAG: YccF domain-containing protein [Anaerolineaceae bacterium]|nr:YccF domain-containing protein [Anaerolineaceae bacterium]
MYTTVVDKRDNPGCLIQLLWFALVGWWLGQLWIAVAWFLMVTIVGIPLGVMMLNKLPRVIALRDEAHRVAVSARGDGMLVQREIAVPETDMLVRALYFIVIGWWLSALWMEAAYAISLTVIGLPVGFWMFDRVPTVVSLKHS